MGKAISFTLPFIKKEKVAKDTYTFYFKRDKKLFDFEPGQYVRMSLPHDADERGTTRYFTISSSPLNKEYLTITTKIIKSTFKKILFDLEEGTEVNFFGPMGWFLLPKDEKEEKVFIAGGIGVTPFHSLLTTLAEEKLPAAVTLLATFSSDEDAIFFNELTEVTKKNQDISVVYSFSRISDETIKKHISDLYKSVFYIVGSEEMVATTKKVLVDLGVDEEKIQTEDFTGY